MESIFAVNCLDPPDSPDLSAYETYAKDFSARRRRGARTSPGERCRARVAGEVHRRPPQDQRRRSDPIVVVGTTRDPATIYEWSKRLRDQLDNAVPCPSTATDTPPTVGATRVVDSAIDAYYVQGRCPQDGLRC